MTDRPASVDQLLAACDAPTRRLVEGARKRILSAVPTAVERFRAGWGLIGYNAPAYFAFVLVDHRGVLIGFEWGVLLSDWTHVLEGDLRQVRYFAVKSAADLKQPALTALLQEAAALKPPNRRQRTT
jgi:hypothetical protein